MSGEEKRGSGNASQPKKKKRKVIVFLFDSLNRSLLNCYGNTNDDKNNKDDSMNDDDDDDEVIVPTPNIDRLAKRSVCFNKHYVGSLPCIPARHDLLVGNVDFLWRPWGSIEHWEESIVDTLSRKEIPSAIITDHPHLFESGGENYHTGFSMWEYLRGGESDPWRLRPDLSDVKSCAMKAASRSQLQGKSFHLRKHPSQNKLTAEEKHPSSVPSKPKHYDVSRTYFKTESEYPGPKTMTAAVDWLKRNGQSLDEFFLFVDEFSPHEPFDVTERWMSDKPVVTGDERLIWPPYAQSVLRDGVLTKEQAQELRSNYHSSVRMIDHWFGKVLDVLDRQELWDECTVVMTSDHGIYLGEHDIFGKPLAPHFETMSHIPLLISMPGISPFQCDALTTTVDVHATLRDLFDVANDSKYRQHGQSLLPLLRKETTIGREFVLSGVYGQFVQVVNSDGVKYGRAPTLSSKNFPLSMYTNRWSTMPLAQFPNLKLPMPDERAVLDTMPGTTCPVIKQVFKEGDLLPYWAMHPKLGEHYLFDLSTDANEETNLAVDEGEEDNAENARVRLEARMKTLLVRALKALEAPEEQFLRLGLY